MYAKVENGIVEKVVSRPDWRDDEGNQVSDAILAAHGYLPVIDAPIVGADQLLNTFQWNDVGDWLISDGHVERTYTLLTHSLVTLKGMALHQIDEAAELARSAFVTQGTGQALEYEQTRQEVNAWVATTNPSVDDFPMIRAERNARRLSDPTITPEEVVLEIFQEFEVWRVVGSGIKEIRRTAKIAVELAAAPARVREIVDWSTTAYEAVKMTGAFEPLL